MIRLYKSRELCNSTSKAKDPSNEFLESLKSETFGRCAYCDQTPRKGVVEHIIPHQYSKKKYRVLDSCRDDYLLAKLPSDLPKDFEIQSEESVQDLLARSYNNLTFACHECNTLKESFVGLKGKRVKRLLSTDPYSTDFRPIEFCWNLAGTALPQVDAYKELVSIFDLNSYAVRRCNKMITLLSLCEKVKLKVLECMKYLHPESSMIDARYLLEHKVDWRHIIFECESEVKAIESLIVFDTNNEYLGCIYFALIHTEGIGSVENHILSEIWNSTNANHASHFHCIVN